MPQKQEIVGASASADRAGRASPEPASSLGHSATIPCAVYVIIGSSGEYSDRYERVIGYVLTEADAQAAVIQAEAEKSLPNPVPYPAHENTYAWVMPDGTVCDALAPVGAKWREKPDAANIMARRDAAIAQWRKARIDAGRIDPDGPMDTYYYEAAPAIAIETQRAETENTGSVAKR